MDFAIGFIVAAVLGIVFWHFFPKIKEKETIVFKDVISEVQHLEASAEACVKQVEDKFKQESGEFKASQAFRMMLNIHPVEDAQKIRLAIELAVRKCLGQ